MMDDTINITQPDIETQWKTWKLNPTPEANANMLKSLNPTIDRAIHANVGVPNPLLRSRARSMTLKALQTYDPTKSKLNSHIYNQLKGLKRYNAQMSQGVRLPERAVLDRRTMDNAVAELTDQNGREPSDNELADYTGFSTRRLAKLRQMRTAMTEGFFSGLDRGGDDEGGHMPAVARNDTSNVFLRAIYDDLSPLDQKVFEWSLGFNGQPMLQNQKIASKLRRTPGWVSQRKLLIQKMLDDAMGMNLLGSL